MFYRKGVHMNEDKLVEKWLSSELSEEELNEFESLTDSQFYKRIVEDASMFRARQFSSVPNFEAFRKKVPLSGDKKVAKKEYVLQLSPILKIASIILVALGIFYFTSSDGYSEISTDNAQKLTVSLPDQSQVRMNAGSEIRYNEGEWESQRRIELKGEAYFDVAKGKRFDVVTQDGTISVLGTEFNVKQRDGYFEVACYEGSVAVKTDRTSVVLKIGDKVRILNDVVIDERHSIKVPSWLRERSYFENLPLSEVFFELERQYDIKVEASNVDVGQLFTGGFTHTDLKDALKEVSLPLSLEYEVIKPKVVRFVMSD